jgi:hypothetical protein
VTLIAWLRRYLLRDHEREHEVVDAELAAIRAELTALERVVRLRRLEAAMVLRARRHGAGS